MDKTFWDKLDALIDASELIIDRPKNSRHPTFTRYTYPYDYGYLKGTSGGDGEEVDVWRGSLKQPVFDSILCTVDTIQKDAELKVLLGCSEEDKKRILSFYNESGFFGAILVSRIF